MKTEIRISQQTVDEKEGKIYGLPNFNLLIFIKSMSVVWSISYFIWLNRSEWIYGTTLTFHRASTLHWCSFVHFFSLLLTSAVLTARSARSSLPSSVTTVSVCFPSVWPVASACCSLCPRRCRRPSQASLVSSVSGYDCAFLSRSRTGEPGWGSSRPQALCFVDSPLRS